MQLFGERLRIDLSSTAQGGDAPFCDFFNSYGTCWQKVVRSNLMQNSGPELSALGSTVIGRLQDPLTWCLIGVVAVLAWQHYRLWQTFLVMVAFAAVNITTMRIWMAADGRSFPTKETWRMFLTLLLIGLAAHGIGYADLASVPGG